MGASSYDSASIIAFISVCFALTTFVVALRFASRKVSKADFWWDDWVILLSLLFSYGNLITDIFAVKFGAGRHQDEVGFADFLYLLKITFAVEIIYPLIVSATKTSFLLFYIRIFGIHRCFKRTAYTIQALVVIWCIGDILVEILQCNPVSYNFIWSPQDRHCIAIKIPFLITAIPNTLLDFVILILPMTVIWTIQLSLRRKIAISAVFLIGGLVCVFSVIRAWALANVKQTDATYSYTSALYWTNAETSVGIICACLPALQPLNQKLFGGEWSRIRSSSRSGGSSSRPFRFWKPTHQSNSTQQTVQTIPETAEWV